MNSEPGSPPSSLHELPPAMRKFFMQSVAAEIWRRGRRHGANAVVAAVGADRAHRELGTETEVVAFVAVVVGGEHASVQREERGRGGRSCTEEGLAASPQGHLIPIKGCRGCALGARAHGDGDEQLKDKRETLNRCSPNGRRGTWPRTYSLRIVEGRCSPKV